MACYYPWEPDRSLGFPPHTKFNCGRCIGCRLERSRQWAIRCIHEAALHERNCYLTLTYDDQHVPAGHTLRHRDWQLFAKRTRKKMGPFRYYMCGEYGEQFSRPHFHACVFGLDFDDKQLLPNTDAGSPLRRSPTLEKLWPYGYSSIGQVNFQTAAYVARYVMKKVNGNAAETHYTYIDADGEIHQRQPEYNRMSTGRGTDRGIGYRWYKRYKNDVYPTDEVINNGRPAQPPRYYDKLLKTDNRELHDKIKKNRIAAADKSESRPSRLKAREAVQQARLSHLKRTLA